MSTTLWWAVGLAYVVGLTASLVAACSAYRYRSARTEKNIKPYDENTWEAVEELGRVKRERSKNIESFNSEIAMAAFWPASILVAAVVWAAIRLYDLASLPGEWKARRDGLITKEKK